MYVFLYIPFIVPSLPKHWFSSSSSHYLLSPGGEANNEVSIEAISDNSQLSVKFPNGGEILSAVATKASAAMALELDYRGQLFRPLLSPSSFKTNLVTLPLIHDTVLKVGVNRPPQPSMYNSRPF